MFEWVPLANLLFGHRRESINHMIQEQQGAGPVALCCEQCGTAAIVLNTVRPGMMEIERTNCGRTRFVPFDRDVRSAKSPAQGDGASDR